VADVQRRAVKAHPPAHRHHLGAKRPWRLGTSQGRFVVSSSQATPRQGVFVDNSAN
jgi:hypothetical protein